MRFFRASTSFEIERIDVIQSIPFPRNFAKSGTPEALKALLPGFLTLTIIWSCSIQAADDKEILHDRFEFPYDIQGPTIQILPPENWALSNSVSVTFQDPSGLATRAASGLTVYAGGGFNEELTPFFEPTTETTIGYFFKDFNNLFGNGSQVIVVAQDIYGNLSRESTTFVADSPIRTGTYVLGAPFSSDPIVAEYCDFSSYVPESIVFDIEAVDVRVDSGDFFTPSSDCYSGDICLNFNSGGLVAETLDGYNTTIISAFSEVNLKLLDISKVSTPISVRTSWSGGAYGSSVSATFYDEIPRRLTADIEMYCFTPRYEEPLNGCPIPNFPDCDVDTFGPFSVEVTLQPE